MAAYLNILFLAGRFYIKVEPTWVITEDGLRVKGGADIGRILIKWTGAERNLNLLYHLRFWTRILRGANQQNGGGSISIKAGDYWMDVSHIPALIDQSYGIQEDRQDLLGLLDEEAPMIASEEEKLIDEQIDLSFQQLAQQADENVVAEEDGPDKEIDE